MRVDARGRGSDGVRGPLQRGLGMRWVDDAECLDEFESGVVGTEAEVHPAAEGHNRRSISSRLAGTPPAVAATRYHRARCTGWRPLSHGGNASRVVRRGLPCCPAQATAVRGSPTLRRSPTTSTPRNHVRPPRGAGTTGMARSAMMALWAPGLGGDLVITDPTRSRLLRFSARPIVSTGLAPYTCRVGPPWFATGSCAVAGQCPATPGAQSSTVSTNCCCRRR